MSVFTVGAGYALENIQRSGISKATDQQINQLGFFRTQFPPLQEISLINCCFPKKSIRQMGHHSSAKTITKIG